MAGQKPIGARAGGDRGDFAGGKGRAAIFLKQRGPNPGITAGNEETDFENGTLGKHDLDDDSSAAGLADAARGHTGDTENGPERGPRHDASREPASPFRESGWMSRLWLGALEGESRHAEPFERMALAPLVVAAGTALVGAVAANTQLVTGWSGFVQWVTSALF